MARISVPRSRNSRATSWISRTDCVTRTTPSWPTTSARRWARSPPPSRLPLACGLTTTPIPGTSGGRACRGELPAGGLDVLPAALADGGADPVRAQDRLEAEDAGAGARGEPGAGERVEGDQVHLDAKPVQQVDEAAGVRVGIVLAGEEHVLEGDALAARQRQLAAGAQERRERKAAVDGHQTVPLRVGRRAERHGEVDARLGDETRDGGREADRRDRDPPGGDGVAPFGGEDLEGGLDRSVVGERLPHAHEDDVGERRRGREIDPGTRLPTDLGGTQAADEPHPCRRAEAAAHAAAGLARDAEREAVPGAVRAADLRDQHALDRRRRESALARQVEEELPRPVGRLGDERRLDAIDAELRREPCAERARETRHLVEGRGALAVQPRQDLAGSVTGLTDPRTPGLEARAVEVLDVLPRHVAQLSAAAPRPLPRGGYGPRAITSWRGACPGGRYGITTQRTM